jgi:plastocyanin
MNLNINKLRKPTAGDATLHFISNHHMQHKLAAYRYHIHRTHTLPLLEQNKHSEMNTNKQLKKKKRFSITFNQAGEQNHLTQNTSATKQF